MAESKTTRNKGDGTTFEESKATALEYNQWLLENDCNGLSKADLALCINFLEFITHKEAEMVRQLLKASLFQHMMKDIEGNA